jgi:NADH dehydrogenase
VANALENSEKKHVVIVGAGFAGLEAAKLLAREDVALTVVVAHIYHLFQPLLYQVSSAAVSPADIATPVRSVLRGMPSTEVLMATVDRIDPAQRLIHLDRSQTLSYDYLVLATGARHSYFNHPEWEKLAPGLKNLEDATEIRRRILTAFEDAERIETPGAQGPLLNFVIVGGGPTGLELAGAIAELSRYAIANDFNHINPTSATVTLIEAGPRVLASGPAAVSAKAQKQLEKLGVKVRLDARVTAIKADGVEIGSEFLPSRTVIWAAGVQPSPLGKDLGAPLDKAGRVLVGPDLSVPGHPEVFVCGDLAAVPWKDGIVPGQAPGAMQGGRHAARNILRLIRGEKTKAFQYVDKGSMATIGRAKAVAEFKGMIFSGRPAWVLWLAVHIFYLIGFRNRFLVLFQWAWSYITFQRGTRLITGGADRARVALPVTF